MSPSLEISYYYVILLLFLTSFLPRLPMQVSFKNSIRNTYL